MSNQVWEEDAVAQASDIDFQERAKLASFFLWMQNAASNHADALGFGFEAMLARELAWVLTRVKVRIFAYPRMGERILVQTWPKAMQQKIFFMRDHRLTTPSGDLIALATSAYVVISTRTRRITLANALENEFPTHPGLHALDEALEKIPAPPQCADAFQMPIGYSAVDVMGHVNNARYIEWISDCFTLEEYRQARPAWLQINYLNEVKAGETVTLQRGSGSQSEVYLSALNQTSGAKAFEALLGWEALDGRSAA